MERRADEIALQKKIELRSELVNELATKTELNAVKTELKADIERVRTELKGEIENARTEFRGEIAKVRTELWNQIDKLNMKLNFLIILVIIVLTLMNPVVAELIKKWAGLR